MGKKVHAELLKLNTMSCTVHEIKQNKKLLVFKVSVRHINVMSREEECAVEGRTII